MSRLLKRFFINIITTTMKQGNSIAVIDMRAFYSYVECIDRNLNPYTTPLVVADKERGTNTIVLSVSPYLKNKGVPSRLRIKELPSQYHYIYAVPRMARYLEMSSEIFSLILDFVSEEDLHIYSIDEGFINLTPYLKLYKSTPYQMMRKIKDAIKEKTGLECTVGIGDNMFLAKVALDCYAKKEKDGIAELRNEDIKEKLWPIYPLNKIWGIGENLNRRLNALGIYKVEDLAKTDRNFIRHYLGIIGDDLVDHANGIDNSNIREKYIPKETSLSSGQVLFKDYKKEEAILIIRELCDDLLSRLRRQRQLTSCVHLYIGYSKQGGFSKQMSLIKPSDDNDVIYRALLKMYQQNIDNEPIRRISICVSKLTDADQHQQLDLFLSAIEQEKKRNLLLTLDNIQIKYGNNAVLRASSLLKYSTIKERHTFIGGHHR